MLPPNNAQGKGVYGCWHQDGQILCTGEEGWSLWNGNDALGNPVGSGVYLYQLKSGHFSKTKKMVISR